MSDMYITRDCCESTIAAQHESILGEGNGEMGHIVHQLRRVQH